MSDFLIAVFVVLAIFGFAARKAARKAANAANSPLGQALIGQAIKRLK